MKHLFYLSLFLLCVACSVEDVSLIPEETAGSETRAGHISMWLTDQTIDISWSEPFGPNVGINVTVYDGSSSVAYYSSPDAYGRSTFSLTAHYTHTWSLDLYAIVTPPGGPYYGQQTVPVTNLTSDPNNPGGSGSTQCYHQSITNANFSVEQSQSSLDELFFYTDMNTFGLMVAQFTIPTNVYVYNPKTDSYGYETVVTSYAYTHQYTGSQSNIVRMYPYLPINYLAFGARINCVVRLYDASCSKLSTGVYGFPICNHYYESLFSINPYPFAIMSYVW